MQIDNKLKKAIRKGDEKVIYQLYNYCYDQLYSICRRYSQNADDIGTMLNIAFMKILDKMEKYDGAVPFEAWIKRIMINTAIDHYRKHKKYRETISFPERNVAEWDLATADYNLAEQNFDAQQLLSLIHRLPPMSASVFNLYVMDGYSHKEIGSLLNISDGTSKWHLSNARHRLQEMIVQELERTNKKSKV